MASRGTTTRDGTPDGPRLFTAFLKENGITLREAGKALGVAHVTILKYRRGVQPKEPIRLAIEVWTWGKVPAKAWLTPAERRQLKRLTLILPHESPKTLIKVLPLSSKSRRRRPRKTRSGPPTMEVAEVG